jgi:hypothetical protein
VKLLNKILLISSVIGLISCQENADTSQVIPKTTDAVIDSTRFMTSDEVESYIYPIDTVVLGDINSDKISDTVFINEPSIIEEEMTCRDDVCKTQFIFSGGKIPSFGREQALGGVIGNAGDLDDDGICEIYFVPDWFTSSWTAFVIYRLSNNEWKEIANASVRREDWVDEKDKLYLPYQKRIAKHNKEYFELIENVMDDEGNEHLFPKKFYFTK